MISFAVGELGCNLDYAYYEMTWAEFRIRSFAFLRMQKREEYKLRELAWTIYIAPYQDPKKMKRSKKAFWPIDGDKKASGPTDKMIKIMEDAQRQYLKDKQNGRGQ